MGYERHAPAESFFGRRAIQAYGYDSIDAV